MLGMNWPGNLKLPVHKSWIVASSAAGIVAGLALSHQLTVLASWPWVLVGLGLLIGATILSRRVVLPLAILAGLLIGGARGATDLEKQAVWSGAIGQTVTLRGTVVEDIDRGKNGEITLRLANLRYKNRPLSGEVWLSLSGEAPIRRSDIIQVEVLLRDGFGSFVASGYKAELVDLVRPKHGDVALDVRDWFADAVRKVIDEPMASLGLGFLTGQRRSLPPELDDALRTVGLTHIVVASGYNLTILVRLIKRLFEKHSRFQTVFFASLLIGGFIAITGMTPSMMRAGLVTGLALGAWYIGRQFHPVRLLVLAAAITGLITPSYVWGNLGWQLSFLAFSGVMILAPLMQRYFFGENPPGLIRQILGETLSATIMTLPLLLLYFGKFSVVALLANMLVLPLLPLAMLATFVAGLGEIVSGFSYQIIGLPAELVLGYMLKVTEFFASLPWAIVEVEVPGWQAGIMYLALIGAMLYMWRATKLNLRNSSIIE